MITYKPYWLRFGGGYRVARGEFVCEVCGWRCEAVLERMHESHYAVLHHAEDVHGEAIPVVSPEQGGE